MQLQTWKIQGRAFHFGEHGIGQEESRVTWPSDSLYAALLARLVLLQGEQALTEWLGSADAPTKPRFLLTSTFPYAGGVRFFPVPLAALRNEGSSLPPNWRPKDLKKVRFVSEGIYRALLDGKSLAAVLTDGIIPLHGKTAWVLKGESGRLPQQRDAHGRKLDATDRRFWALEKRPRVAVGRAPNNSNLFHVGAVRFAHDCGLWFGVQWLSDDAEARAQLANLLADLGDAGLGAERSSGYGQAKITPDDAPLELPAPGNGPWTTLSRYLPAPDEIPALQDRRAAYQVTRLSGWMDSRGLRRRAVNLLAEGAVLGPLAEKTPPYGMIVDVRPISNDLPHPVEHPVWRAGLAVAVGIKESL